MGERQVDIRDDMGGGATLRLVEQEDGDVVICMAEPGEYGSVVAISMEVCANGTRYPWLAAALRRVMDAALDPAAARRDAGPAFPPGTLRSELDELRRQLALCQDGNCGILADAAKEVGDLRRRLSNAEAALRKAEKALAERTVQVGDRYVYWGL